MPGRIPVFRLILFSLIFMINQGKSVIGDRQLAFAQLAEICQASNDGWMECWSHKNELPKNMLTIFCPETGKNQPKSAQKQPKTVPLISFGTRCVKILSIMMTTCVVNMATVWTFQSR